MSWLSEKFKEGNKTWEKDKLRREELQRRADFKAKQAWDAAAPAREALARAAAKDDWALANRKLEKAMATFPDLLDDDQGEAEPGTSPAMDVPVAEAPVVIQEVAPKPEHRNETLSAWDRHIHPMNREQYAEAVKLRDADDARRAAQ